MTAQTPSRIRNAARLAANPDLVGMTGSELLGEIDRLGTEAHASQPRLWKAEVSTSQRDRFTRMLAATLLVRERGGVAAEYLALAEGFSVTNATRRLAETYRSRGDMDQALATLTGQARKVADFEASLDI